MSNRSNLVHPRDEIMRTMERIYRYRMTTTSGGNLSIRDDDGAVWITPARVDKGNIRREDIIRVGPDGTADGPHRPSSEYPFHCAIYDARPDVRGIVHAHPVALVAFSITRRVPDTRLFHPARLVCGAAGFAPYALPGSAALAENIAHTFAQNYDCVVLENHGVVTAGDSLQRAFQRFETLEFTAKTIIKAGMIGTPEYLDDAQINQPRPEALPQFDPDPPASAEKELRRQLCDFVRRGYQQRLLISTEGSFSARLDGESFLITPYRVDRQAVDVGDVVLVRNGAAETGKIPSRAARLHQAIYDRHPDVGSVVNAYPVNATAFSVTRAALDARTIPESYILLRDVARIEYGVQFSDVAEAAQAGSSRRARPVALLDNDGVLVCGSSVLDAFDRLEVLETTAEALINSRPLGPVAAMSDAVIAELNQAFSLN